MRRLARAGAGAGVAVGATGLAVFLVSQGLVKASLWASVLGLPVALIIAVAGVWAALLAAKAPHGHGQGQAAGTTSKPNDDGTADDTRSGSIYQVSTSGTAMGSTGSGDIHYTSVTGLEPPNEPSGPRDA